MLLSGSGFAANGFNVTTTSNSFHSHSPREDVVVAAEYSYGIYNCRRYLWKTVARLQYLETVENCYTVENYYSGGEQGKDEGAGWQWYPVFGTGLYWWCWLKKLKISPA